MTVVVVVDSGPLPMEDITRMADECMRDVDDDGDDDDVEGDEDLLVCVCLYSSLLLYISRSLTRRSFNRQIYQKQLK